MIRATLRNIIKDLNIYFGDNSDKSVTDDMIINISKDGLCISFGIDNGRQIVINELHKCGFTGTELLERIELLAQDKNISTILLDDQSSVNFGDYKFDLATLSIITKGRSWYNSLGYYSNNHSIEQQEWEIIRESKLDDLFNYILTIDYEKYISKNKGWYHDGLLFFCSSNEITLNEDNYNEVLTKALEYLSVEFDLDETVKSFGIRLSIISKNNTSEEYEVIKYLLMLSVISYAIEYTRYPLIKNV